MAEERDPKVSQHYRSLETLEPSSELDQAVLAASRRASGRKRNRWYTSLAAAAVLVFAVALTLHLERDRPDAEAPPRAPLKLEQELRGSIKPAPAESKAEATNEAKGAPVFAPDPQASQAPKAAARSAPAPRRQPAPDDDLISRRDQAGAERANVQAERARQSSSLRQEAPSASAAPAAAAVVPERPDRWLE